MWKPWSREYVRSLRERHVNGAWKQADVQRKESTIIIQNESKDRNVWRLGIVTDLIKGLDGVETSLDTSEMWRQYSAYKSLENVSSLKFLRCTSVRTNVLCKCS